jgi:AraC-like DNA-binding protein
VQFVLGINAAIATILLALLLRRVQRLRADRWLVLALGVLISTAIGLALNNQPDQPPAILLPLAIFVGGSSFFVTPISLFLYVRDVSGRFKLADLIWFLPPVLHLTWMLWEAYFGDGVLFVHGFAGVESGQGVARRILSPLSILFTLLFPGWALVELARYRERIKQHVSGLDGVDLSWVRAVLWSVIAGGLVATVLMALAANHVWIELEQASALVMLIVGLQLGATGYFALFQNQPPVAVSAPTVEPVGAVDLEACAADFVQLQHVMRTDQLYRQEDFRLGQLADALGWAPYRIGEALQHAAQLNFFDFVNGFRVAEVSELLADPANDRISVLSLAFDAGFQSKASFNRIFKAHTGETPSQYRRRSLPGDGTARPVSPGPHNR